MESEPDGQLEKVDCAPLPAHALTCHQASSAGRVDRLASARGRVRGLSASPCTRRTDRAGCSRRGGRARSARSLASHSTLVRSSSLLESAGCCRARPVHAPCSSSGSPTCESELGRARRSQPGLRSRRRALLQAGSSMSISPRGSARWRCFWTVRVEVSKPVEVCAGGLTRLARPLSLSLPSLCIEHD